METTLRCLTRSFSGAGKVPHPDWSNLDAFVLEQIMLKLPEASVVRASNVCSRWHAVVRDALFTEFYVSQNGSSRACRFSVSGSKHCFQQTQAGRYDILSAREFYQGPVVSCKDGEISCLEGAGGLFYAFTGAHQTTVYYKLSMLQKEWLVTPEMHFRMHDPIVGVVRQGCSGAHKLVFAGGIADVQEDDDDLAVQVFDSASRTWTRGSPLPYQFRGCTSSLFMNPAVYRGRFFAYDTYASFVSELDLATLGWSAVDVVRRPPELKRAFLMGDEKKGMSLVGLQNSGVRDLTFHVWNVDPQTLQLQERTQSTIIPNARPAPPSTLRRYCDWSLDHFGSAVGVVLLLIAHAIVLCYGWTTRTGAQLQGLILGLRLPSLRALAGIASKDAGSSALDSGAGRRFQRMPSFLVT
ncbi:hypothetical protein MPTK1_4g07180 [Marchantia polymorpha subsp. ruderalis]|uniref:F-box domain-containing protein n=2 Tax=Marchantia polymorpha TaxID=3197 RepID=A0AAF6B7C2_MARPO|nr:hypothetical protein MARPO_0115s0063 [Marchantia polymorpha]BBN07906.1 hypothetical protein Mp_4g07180 [Marchantia polymorpha subsp. ruderalis]|eukprot:PTQ31148.1 hypothetical protein MARPO_0115s0063 [Marchantia polymorpha]